MNVTAPNRLLFKDDKTPYSSRFDDLYFSKDLGIEESNYVYLEGTGALAAIRNRIAKIRIAEVGFGVGLNFILTLRAFLKESSKEQTLYYFSAEKFPIEKEDLFSLYRAYPELLSYAETLLSQYPILTPGIHRLFFGDGRIILDLFIGEASDAFMQSDFTADFWYWDGFSPSKNPDAFSETLFAAVRERSSLTARGSSFTAAGWVRRALEVNGFLVSKRKGHGKKRECIEASIHPDSCKPHSSSTIVPPWFSRQNLKPIQIDQGEIAVLGAGLAGSAIARNLSNRGFQVKVYDGNGIANRASSNSAALFDVQLSTLPSPLSQFAQRALSHFLNELQFLSIPNRLGILRRKKDYLPCLENSKYPDNFYEIRGEDIYFPYCGMINPQALCKARFNHPLIQVIQESVARTEKTGSIFSLFNASGALIGSASQLVYAMGADMVLVLPPTLQPILNDLSLRAIRGQTILVKPTPESIKLSSIRLEDGYLTPIHPEITGHPFHLVGSTYQAKNIATDQKERDTQSLLTGLIEKWPEHFNQITEESVVSQQVGFRASTPDTLPLIGPLSSLEACNEDFGKSLRYGHRSDTLPALRVKPGEWIFTGFGSRGVTFSSLGAEILASLMVGDPMPIEQNLSFHLHPARFYIRNLKKTKV